MVLRLTELIKLQNREGTREARETRGFKDERSYPNSTRNLA